MGFAIRSTVPLRYLRSGTDGQPVEINESERPLNDVGMLQEWASSRGELSIRLLDGVDGLIVENDLMGRFLVDRERSKISMPPAPGVPAPLREAFLWSTPFAIAGSDVGSVVVHSAAVEVDGRAILLMGDTGAGKTTLSAAFHAAGHRLLSDDGARCRAEDGSVWPGPALLRIRNDMSGRIDRADLEFVHETPDKTHFAVAVPRRGGGDAVPISAIVFLHWGPEAANRVEAEMAIARMWPLSFYLPAADGRRDAFSALGEIARRVPSYDFSRPRTGGDPSFGVDRLLERCLP